MASKTTHEAGVNETTRTTRPRATQWQRIRVILAIAAILTFFSTFAAAQNYSGDARKIGLGGGGDGDNITSQMVGQNRSYRAIVLPFGVIQALRNLDRFNPENDDFDPVFAMEYAASPLHYTFNREPSGSSATFINDLVNGKLSRDLNAYHGFVPAGEIVAEGLTAPTIYGHTFKFAQDAVSYTHLTLPTNREV